MKKKKIIAFVIMLLVVILALPLGVRRSLLPVQEKAMQLYYYDKTGYAIYQGINIRMESASNLVTVAKKYTDANPKLTALTEEVDRAVQMCRNTYEYDDGVEKVAQANEGLDQPARELAAELEKTKLSEYDAKFPKQMLAQMDSEQDKIQRSTYNEEARAYNEKLRGVPLELLTKAAFLKPMHVFE